MELILHLKKLFTVHHEDQEIYDVQYLYNWLLHKQTSEYEKGQIHIQYLVGLKVTEKIIAAGKVPSEL